jgi:hypothetical protein
MNAVFDKTHRDAVDTTAALMFSSGIKYNHGKKICSAHWEVCPPVITKLKSDIPNLIGFRFGYFRVIGLSRNINGRWIVRCDCGDYELRTAKAIRNKQNFGDRCHICRQKAFDVKDYIYSKTGRETDQRTI